jgi:hypothetical protein
MTWGAGAVTVTNLLMLAACGGAPAKPVEDLAGGADVSRFTMTSVAGTRDGERLTVRVVYSDGPRELTLDLRFQIGVPTRLASGRWTGPGGAGIVQERSVTFLGGQSGPPSLGGRFDLLGPNDAALYRVTIPVQPLDRPL